ncbi:MAG: hypothetical protein AAB433_22725 [Nitrospirota bacterium]
MEQIHCVPELLIPTVSAVRIRGSHRLSTELIVPHAAQAMAQQCGSYFERHAEIL